MDDSTSQPKICRRLWTPLAGVLFLIIWTGEALWAADWPQYRGPNRDGRSTETGMLRSWSSDGPQQLWRSALGSGYSGIAVTAGRVFTLFSDEKAEYMVALSAADGEEVWRHHLDSVRTDSQGDGPRATPTIDGNRAFVLGARGRLAAVDVESGNQNWVVDLRSELGAKVPQWGVSTSPLVEGDLLIVEVGGQADRGLVAFDKSDGRIVWSTVSGKPGYSSPIAVTLLGRRQVIFFPAEGLVGVAADTGERLWSVPWKTSYDVNAATPIFVPRDSFFISTGYDTGAALVRVRAVDERYQADFEWKSRDMKNHFNSSVVVGDLLFGFDNAILKCLDVRSGREYWRARGSHGGYGKGASLLYADGLLFVLGGEGLLGLVEATPEDYRELTVAQVFDGRSWTMPSLADGVLFVRDFREIAAFRVKE